MRRNEQHEVNCRKRYLYELTIIRVTVLVHHIKQNIKNGQARMIIKHAL